MRSLKNRVSKFLTWDQSKRKKKCSREEYNKRLVGFLYQGACIKITRNWKSKKHGATSMTCIFKPKRQQNRVHRWKQNGLPLSFLVLHYLVSLTPFALFVGLLWAL